MATPETVEEEILKLKNDIDYRHEIGRRSREFALKYHSSYAGAKKIDSILSEFLNE